MLEQGLDLDIWIADNGSKPEVIKMLRARLHPSIHLVELGHNKGWGPALNVLLRNWLEHDVSPFCLKSDDDALPQPGCLQRLIDVISTGGDERIGIASAEYGVAHFPVFSPIRGPRLVPRERPKDGTIEPVPFPWGTIFAIRRECLEAIGLFDERYFMYGDDYEIGLRAWRHDWKVVVVWGSIVINPISDSLPSPVKTYLFARNTLLLAKEYGSRYEAAVRAFLIAGNTVHLSLSRGFRENEINARWAMARMMGIRDFLRGQFGPPPPSLLEQVL
jgi:GT2 family glycosyltransferase